MSKIIGNPTVTPMAIPDWNQKDKTKADYIKNKPTVLTEKEIIDLISKNGGGSGNVDLSDYYTINQTDAKLQKKEDKNNKITLDEWQKSTDIDSLLTDERYLSAYLAYVMHEGLVLDINRVKGEMENHLNKIPAEGESRTGAKYYSAKATQEYVSDELNNYYTKEETDNKLSSVYKYCGSVDNISELPSNVAIGDTYNILNTSTVENYFANVNWEGKIVEPGLPLLNVFDEFGNNIDDKFRGGNIATTDTDSEVLFVIYDEEYNAWVINLTITEDISLTTFRINSLSCDAGDNLAWTGFTWDNLGGTVDLSNYATNTEVDEKIAEVDEKIVEVNNKISTVYKYCGSIEEVNKLPSFQAGENIGHTYNIIQSDSAGRSYYNFDLTGKTDDRSYLKIFNSKHEEVTSLIPHNSVLICSHDAFGNPENRRLVKLTTSGWETNPPLPSNFNAPIYWYEQTISCESGDNLAWTGYGWDNLGGTVDLSNYAIKSDTEEALKTKQDISNMIDTIEDYREDKYPSEAATQRFVVRLMKEEIDDSMIFVKPEIPEVSAVVKYVNNKLSSYVEQEEYETTIGDISSALDAILALQSQY